MLAYLIAAAILPALIMGYPLRPCPGGIPAPVEVRIAECPSSPCNVQPGQIINFEADYINTIFTTFLRVNSTMVIFNVEADITLDDRNGCASTTPTCPHFEDQFITIAREFRIPNFPPTLPAVMRVLLYNSFGLNVVCAEMHGITVAPSTETV